MRWFHWITFTAFERIRLVFALALVMLWPRDGRAAASRCNRRVPP